MKSNTITFKTEAEFRKYLKTLRVMPTAYNREVKTPHMKKMEKSITTIGLQRPTVVIRTDAFGIKDGLYIADGQHMRKSILENKNMKIGGHLVSYENNIEKIEDIIPFVSQMNSTAKNWSQKDYLNAWTTQGAEEYVFLSKKFEELPYTLSCILEAFVIDRKNVDAYRNGKVRVNEFLGNQILKAYKAACAAGLNDNTSAFLATARFFKYKSQIPIESFVNMIARNQRVFRVKTTRDGYMAFFETFYKA